MHPYSITLRHIRVFLEVVHQHSLRRAAQKLYVSESAVSKSLRELEEALGIRLLQRDRRGATLTKAGEAFHVHALQSATSLAHAIETVQRDTEQRQLLRVGALPTAAAHLVRMAVQQMLERHAGFSVFVESGHYETLVGRLRASELDLIVGRMVSRDTIGLSFELLFEEDIVAVVRPEHPLAYKMSVSMSELSQHLIIAPSPGTQVRAVVDSYLFASAARPLLRHLDTQSETFSRAYTLESDAVWFAPRGLVTPELNRGWLMELPVKSPLLRAPFGLTSVANRPHSTATATFYDIMRGLSVVLQQA